MTVNSRIQGLRDLAVRERRGRVAREAGLEAEALSALEPARGLQPDQADLMIENVVGTLAIPVGIATNFTVNGLDYLIPMATEEPSVVAAASNVARMARAHGGLNVSTTAPVMIAQIQLVDVPNPEAARFAILQQKDDILDVANNVDPVLVDLGGGAQDVEVRVISTSVGAQVVVHLLVDVRDAMGANAVNSMAEALAPTLASIAGGRAVLRILSNKADRRLVRAHSVFDGELLGGADVIDDIVLASALAAADPYRAATHNKGIMNGITAVVLATGNDTRAIEAGCHAHAARNGQYAGLSTFERTPEGNLVGTIEIPLAVGLVGGATRVHPAARAAIELLGVQTASELGAVIAAVGLVQNLAACRALAAEGIQRGHMTLHARTVAASAGATGEEVAKVAGKLVADGKIRSDRAEQVLAELRGTA